TDAGTVDFYLDNTPIGGDCAGVVPQQTSDVVEASCSLTLPNNTNLHTLTADYSGSGSSMDASTPVPYMFTLVDPGDPELTLSAPGLDFGGVKLGSTMPGVQTLTVTNSGTLPVGIGDDGARAVGPFTHARANATIVGDDAAAFAIVRDTCSGEELEPDSTCE